MAEAPLEFLVVEGRAYCDPETGLCLPPAEPAAADHRARPATPDESGQPAATEESGQPATTS